MCRSSCTRLFALACALASLVLVAAGSSVSFADACPAACSQNRFNVDIGADKFEIVSGDTVNYTVTAFNNVVSSDGCDAGVSSCDSVSGHGVVVQFCCPQPNGTPYPFNDFAPGHCTELSASSVGDNFPAAAKPTVVYPPVACVVTVNPGVSTANGIVGAGDVANPGTPNANKGTIHFPAGDRGFQATKPIPVTIDFCGDGIINESCETCDTNDFPANAPVTHGTCRTGECGSPGCTFCGDGKVNGPAGAEDCDDGNAINGDGCNTDCKFVCGDGAINQTCEKCDTNEFPANAPATHGACRTGVDTCGTVGCTFCGDGAVNGPAGAEACDDGNAVNGDGCNTDCTAPCSVRITKTVAPDDGSGGGAACDGLNDGPFVESVTVDATSCVVYEICVINTGSQVLDGNGVEVSDQVLGTVNYNFGTIAVGAKVCKQAPGVITAPVCTGGDPAGTSCICEQVEGLNTAIISAAICDTTKVNACDQPGSDCEDTANVACLTPGSCRMTGGHNFDLPVDAEFDENGKVYTTGGQIGAPNETGCCDLPPKGKCVEGKCTGGLNGGLSCSTNDNCPNDPGRNSHCPWGDWEHNHHSGPDDSNSVKGGSFAFHSGTAAAPNEAFIKSVQCADPGWCVQARPAPFKQIFWEGTGVFRNNKDKRGKNIALPFFSACTDQPVPYSKPNGTIHYYKAHVSDFGEPAGIQQKPADLCVETCSNPEPNGKVEISRQDNVCPSALGDVCFIDQVSSPKETELHPLCLAQTCSECPDVYEIEIHCTADPDSPVAYQVSHFIREGNFQLHPPVGDSCNPTCGDGVCESGVTGTAETCASCSADCGPCN